MNLFIPEAIFVVACATAVNYFCDLDGKYGLRQVRVQGTVLARILVSCMNMGAALNPNTLVYDAVNSKTNNPSCAIGWPHSYWPSPSEIAKI